MARYPRAKWRPLPENTTQPSIVPRSVILHSAVDHVEVDSLWTYFRYHSSLESHFFVKWSGEVEQYLDTVVRADANNAANSFAVSIETEDDGDPNTKRWSPAQVNAIVDLIIWVCDTHRIPRQLCTTWDGPGVGWHTMWGSPSKWTPSVKTCPGTIRIPQFRNEIWPRIAAGTTGGDDGLTPEQVEKLLGQMDQVHTALVKHYERDGGNLNNLDLARPILNTHHWVINLLVPKIVDGVVARLPPTTKAEVDTGAIAAAVAAEVSAALPTPPDPEVIARAVRDEFAKRPLGLTDGAIPPET